MDPKTGTDPGKRTGKRLNLKSNNNCLNQNEDDSRNHMAVFVSTTDTAIYLCCYLSKVLTVPNSTNSEKGGGYF